MSAISKYFDLWVEDFEKNRSTYEEYDSIFPIYENWERLTTAETVAVDLFRNALDLLYASAPRALSEKFFRWVIEVVDRALEDGKLHKTTPHSRFPDNRGQALRSRAYAKALLNGDFGKADAQQALEDLTAGLDTMERAIAEQQHGFDDMEEARVLAPARLALILGDLDRFDELLPYPRKIKWHKVEADLLIDVASTARREQLPSEELTERFIRYFEEVRPPTPIQVESENREHGGTIYCERDLRRFEFGVLYCQYIDASEPFTWHRAIDEISK